MIDTALTHVLTTRMETGEFDPRSDVPWTKLSAGQIQSPAHQALARTVADNALVLLKNKTVTGHHRAAAAGRPGQPRQTS